MATANNIGKLFSLGPAVALSSGVSALLVAAIAVSAPTRADSADDLFLAALDQAGLHVDSSQMAVAMAKEVCNRLVDPAKSVAYATSAMTGNGMPPQLAAFSAGIAVRVYCPQVMHRIGGTALFDWIQPTSP